MKEMLQAWIRTIITIIVVEVILVIYLLIAGLPLIIGIIIYLKNPYDINRIYILKDASIINFFWTIILSISLYIISLVRKKSKSHNDTDKNNK